MTSAIHFERDENAQPIRLRTEDFRGGASSFVLFEISQSGEGGCTFFLGVDHVEGFARDLMAAGADLLHIMKTEVTEDAV